MKVLALGIVLLLSMDAYTVNSFSENYFWDDTNINQVTIVCEQILDREEKQKCIIKQVDDYYERLEEIEDLTQEIQESTKRIEQRIPQMTAPKE